MSLHNQQNNDSSNATQTTELPFFAVSLTKLAIMSMCTFNLYEMYWFYRNWHFVKSRENSKIRPALRSIFAVFFCYQLFSQIRKYGSDRNLNARLFAGPLATGFIITTVLWKLPDPYWWISYFSFVFLLPVQAYANKINLQSNPVHNMNSRIEGWNWLAITLGGLLLIMAIIGTLMAPTK